MKQIAATAVIALGLLAGCAAPATSSKPAATAASSKDSPTATEQALGQRDPDTLVCEIRRVTGSNIPQRVCRTLRQIENERIAAQDDLRRATRPGPKNAQ